LKEPSLGTSYKDNHSIDTTMTTVNTKGLMLGMLAIAGLIAGGAMFTTGQAYARVVNGGGGGGGNNAAVAANSDHDTVNQVNAATT
jgi:hypothetical protein